MVIPQWAQSDLKSELTSLHGTDLAVVDCQLPCELVMRVQSSFLHADAAGEGHRC